jgi:hypothetical protein
MALAAAAAPSAAPAAVALAAPAAPAATFETAPVLPKALLPGRPMPPTLLLLLPLLLLPVPTRKSSGLSERLLLSTPPAPCSSPESWRTASAATPSASAPSAPNAKLADASSTKAELDEIDETVIDDASSTKAERMRRRTSSGSCSFFQRAQKRYAPAITSHVFPIIPRPGLSTAVPN